MKSKWLQRVAFVLCIGCALVFSLFPLELFKEKRLNTVMEIILPLVFATPIAFMVVKAERQGLFDFPVSLVWLLPCLVVVINNLPWIAWSKGTVSLMNVNAVAVIAFIFYCLLVALFEELIFRGVIFPYLIEVFPKNRKGLVSAFFLSSAIFGLAHLLNLISGAGIVGTILQVGYTTLLGGLFSFSLIKTKNIFIPTLLHFIYNFCGLLFDERVGLGYGVAWDIPTVVCTAIIGAAVGITVLIAVFHVSDRERELLYARMRIGA